MANLDFQNYGSATTNGTDLSTAGYAANQYSMGQPATSMSGSSNLANAGVTDTTTVLSNPQGNGMGGAQQGSGFWSKEGGAGLILGGVQVLGNLWNSYQAHKLAKEQMNFAKEQWSTNLENQTQTYNTALEDRIRARHNTEGKSATATNQYLNKHKL